MKKSISLIKTIFCLFALQLVTAAANADISALKAFEGRYTLSAANSAYCPQTGVMDVTVDEARSTFTRTISGYIFDGNMPEQNGVTTIDLNPADHTDQPCLNCISQERTILKGNKIIVQARDFPSAPFWKDQSALVIFKNSTTLTISIFAVPCDFVRAEN